MGEGFIMLPRSNLVWELNDDRDAFFVALYLLKIAAYANTVWDGINIERGQCVTSLNVLSEKCGLTVKQIRRVLKKLEGQGFMASKRTNRYSIITICNFDSYQGADNTKGQAKGHSERATKNNIYKEEDIKKENVILSYKSFFAESKKTLQNSYDSFLENIRQLYPDIATLMVLPSQNEYKLLSGRYNDSQLLNLIGYIDNDTRWKGFTHLNAAIKQYLENSNTLPNFENNDLTYEP